MNLSAIKAMMELLPELRRETTFLANTKTLLTKHDIETLISGLAELQGLCDGREVVIEEWQPLETIPRDGSKFQTYGGGCFGTQGLGWFEGHYFPEKHTFWLVEIQGVMGSYEDLKQRGVTHWKPLAPIPSVSIAAETKTTEKE
jgi:hypothetical protein